MRVQARQGGGGRIFLYILHTPENYFFMSVTFLKGQCHEIFDFRFFSWISFQAPEYLFEKSHRQVHHLCSWKWWQMEKIINKKVLIILFGHLWIVPIIWHRCHWHRWQIYCWFHWYCSSNSPLESLTGGVVDTRGKFFTRCSCHWCHWHRWQICHWCHWYRWCNLTCEYLHKFSTKFEMTGLGGRWFVTKTWQCSCCLLNQ